MKNKLNKKGFTLVELLAVVVILLAISVIAITSISAAIERQKTKQEDATKALIVSQAKLYFDKYKNTVGSNPCVNVIDLIETFNLDPDTLRNSDGQVFDGSVKSDYKYYDTKCS